LRTSSDLPGQDYLKLERYPLVVAGIESRVDDVLEVGLDSHGRGKLLRIKSLKDILVLMVNVFWVAEGCQYFAPCT
jgi:hypothetical protein